MNRPVQPLVTLVVPIRNEVLHIQQCLTSIAAQDFPSGEIECLIVDGDSDDGTLEVVQRIVEADHRFRLLRNPRRTMPNGLNVGIRDASGDFLGVVSGHSVLPRGYVSQCVKLIERTGAWSIGGQIVRIASTPLQHAIALATSSPAGVGDSRHNYATEPGWVESVFPGFWRRDVFRRVGLFDTAMLVNEDNELSHRIRQAGGGIWFDPSIAVEYVPRATFGSLFRQYHGYARGKLRVWRKHRGGLRRRHVVPAALVAFAVGGGAMSVLMPAFAVPWLVGLAVYGGFVGVASLRLAGDEAPATLIAAALVTIHVAYGLGFWRGIIDLLLPAPIEDAERETRDPPLP